MKICYFTIYIIAIFIFLGGCSTTNIKPVYTSNTLPAVEDIRETDPIEIIISEAMNKSEPIKEELIEEELIEEDIAPVCTQKTEIIKSIEVLVLSKQVKAEGTGNFCEDIETIIPAATASPKNATCIPYGRIGRIWKITFNPIWYPPKSIQAEYFQNTGKELSKKFPPGESNPMGKIKFYIEFNGVNSSLGLHGTNSPNSIGKRVTHGCTRLSQGSAFELAKNLLEQEEHDFESIRSKALRRPSESIEILLQNGPSVVHLKE